MKKENVGGAGAQVGVARTRTSFFGMLYFRFSGALLLVGDSSKSEHRRPLEKEVRELR
jgi:hypothetical protein